MSTLRGVCAVAFAVMLCGCGWSGAVNPSFDVSVDDAQRALCEMELDKRVLARPVVVAGGYYDPGTGVHEVAERLRGVVENPEDVIEIAFLTTGSFETARARVIERVEGAFDSGKGDETVEVDVVGISMGGLVARYAAIENGGAHKRLRIRRLFTISTPHRGADLAALPTLDEKQLGMREGSVFLSALYAASVDYEIIPYARLGDVIVGVENCAPDGVTPIWVANRFLEPAHIAAQDDPRFSADIARRLRGEASFATEPRAALPE